MNVCYISHICVSSLELLKNPVCTRCSHSFCRECIMTIKRGMPIVLCAMSQLTEEALQRIRRLESYWERSKAWSIALEGTPDLIESMNLVFNLIILWCQYWDHIVLMTGWVMDAKQSVEWELVGEMKILGEIPP